MPETNPLLIPDAPAELPTEIPALQALLLSTQKAAFRTTYVAVRATLRTQMRQIFANRLLTPQQCFDAYGTNGKWLLRMKAACDDFLLALDPSYVAETAPLALTDDGTGQIAVSVPGDQSSNNP